MGDGNGDQLFCLRVERAINENSLTEHLEDKNESDREQHRVSKLTAPCHLGAVKLKTFTPVGTEISMDGYMKNN